MKRARSIAGLAVGALALAWSSDGRAAGDPYLVYWTIKTPHFRIHYPKSVERVAERVADHAEAIHVRLVPALGEAPDEVTHVLVTDNTDSANGSATAIPYSAMRLYVTAPDDMSPLSEYDDWLLELITHEYTHILHTNQIRGLPALGNVVLGKTFAPNQVQPRWVLEGLAVMEESKHTTGGRNRSSVFDMYLRADVIEGKHASLDQVSNFVRRWPSGNLWYLYGSRFLTWISDVYGDHVMKTVAADYGNLIVPWGINRSVRRATGNTYVQKDDRPALFDGFLAHLGRLYAKQLEKAFSDSPRREGKRLSHVGRQLGRPRFVPKAIWKSADVPEVSFFSDDGHVRAGFYRAPLSDVDGGRWLFARTVGEGSMAYDRKGNAVFSTVETWKRIYPFNDLSWLAAGETSPDGHEEGRERLTRGVRAQDPDITAAGRQVAFTINRKGTTYLATADVTPESTLSEPTVVLPMKQYEQAYTPRFSPDGKRIAYSHWATGGRRDVVVVDLDTRKTTHVTKDRALDMQPSWSPDGKTLFFTSDRTGIPNVYAHDLEKGTTFQVTNVATGAFMPELSPDGKTLLYVGYTHAGFDLFSLDVDRAAWTEAKPYEDTRADPLAEPPHNDWPKEPYSPWPTLRPRAYTMDYGPGNFGQSLLVTTESADIAGFHALYANVSIDSQRADPQFYLGYFYGRLPMDLGLHVFRSLTPRSGYRLSGVDKEFVEEHYGIGTSVSYGVAGPFDQYGVSLSYDASMYRGRLPLGPVIDPQEPITREPVGLGFFGVARAVFQYSSIERYLYSVGPSRGTYAVFSVEYAGKETASEFDFYGFAYGLSRYERIPGLRDHTLFLGGRGGFLGGNYPRTGAFYTGGFVDIPLGDTLKDGIYQGGFVLRGYPPGAYVGRQYHLTTAEYRAPLWHPERGLSTLPIFLNRVSGVAFVDYGGAFDDLDVEHWRSQFHTGYGAELLVDAMFGYGLGLTGRLGRAKGLSREAYPSAHWYFVVSGNY